MSSESSPPTVREEDLAELDAGRAARLERDRALSMSERLAAQHELCAQLRPLAGASGRRGRSLPDLRGLVEALNDRDVAYVVVGAVAAAAHGVVRATRDVDLAPAPDTENLGRLVEALSGLEARAPGPDGRPSDPARDAAPLYRHRDAAFETRLGAIDIVQSPTRPGYAALHADAVATNVLSVSLLVCSLAHLRAIKRAAGRPIDLADLADLDALDGE